MNYIKLIILSYLLVMFGLTGLIMTRVSVIYVLISVELVLFALILSMVMHGYIFDDFTGQILVFIILCIAAVESVLGLSLFVIMHKLRGSLDIDGYQYLKN